MESFDPELKTYFFKIKEEIKLEHIEYIKTHPELKDILNDFISSLLLDKPVDIYEYARQYFSFFNVDKKIEKSKPFIVCGPSGVGKGTILKKLMNQYPENFEFSVSWTTRKQRTNERHGIDYFFKTKEEFEEEIKNNGFVEYMLVHGNYYGTHKSFLENISQRGKICILELDIKGAEKIHSQYPNANYLFFNVKEFDTLKKRIIGRGSDAEDMIEKRLETAKFELENYKKMGFFIEIFNEDLEICYQEVIGYLQKWYPNVKFN